MTQLHLTSVQQKVLNKFDERIKKSKDLHAKLREEKQAKRKEFLETQYGKHIGKYYYGVIKRKMIWPDNRMRDPENMIEVAFYVSELTIGTYDIGTLRCHGVMSVEDTKELSAGYIYNGSDMIPHCAEISREEFLAKCKSLVGVMTFEKLKLEEWGKNENSCES